MTTAERDMMPALETRGHFELSLDCAGVCAPSAGSEGWSTDGPSRHARTRRRLHFDLQRQTRCSRHGAPGALGAFGSLVGGRRRNRGRRGRHSFGTALGQAQEGPSGAGGRRGIALVGRAPRGVASCRRAVDRSPAGGRRGVGDAHPGAVEPRVTRTHRVVGIRRRTLQRIPIGGSHP